MRILIFIFITVLIIHSNDCKTVSIEKEIVATTISASEDSKECLVNTDCLITEACLNRQCKSSCSPVICGYKAECIVHNHNPICKCETGYIGNPFIECIRKDGTSDPDKLTLETESSCGFFSVQRDVQGVTICDCLPGFSGNPPNCKPECKVNSDCATDKVCLSFKCTNICKSECNYNSECKIFNHVTICDCKEGFSGDPYVDCKPIQDQDKI